LALFYFYGGKGVVGGDRVWPLALKMVVGGRVWPLALKMVVSVKGLAERV